MPNPHAGHVGELECTLCHNGHRADELYCSNCHKSMVVKRNATPAGAGAAAK
jgi:fumarate reductase flavoprotein subunit